MKDNSAYEITVNRDAKLQEMIFWGKMALKKMKKINKIFEEVMIKCQADLDKENKID